MFLTKASDTTALSVNSTLFFLALNPACQKRAQDEVDSLFSSGENHELSLDDVGNLKYLEMCWKEAMRLHTPVPFIGRKITKAITLCNSLSNNSREKCFYSVQ
jgi:cytochrome P450